MSDKHGEHASARERRFGGPPRRLVAASAFFAASTLACVGSIDQGGDADGLAPGGAHGGATGARGAGSGPQTPTVFDPSGDVKTSAPPDVHFACGSGALAPATLKKLTMSQVTNAWRDLLTIGLKDAAVADTVWKGLQPAFDMLPADHRPSTMLDVKGSFTRLDQDSQQGQIEALFSIAASIGAELAKAERRASVFGKCATDADATNDGACLDAFITSFGERVLRHPIASDELARFRTIHAATATPFEPAAVADVVAAMLLSPYSLTFVEHGATAVSGKAGTYALSAYELASELSFHLWDTLPDDALWAAAKSGALLTDSGYAAEVDRLLADGRAAKVLANFAFEWLRLDERPTYADVTKTAPFKAMAGTDLPDVHYVAAVNDDALSVFDDVFRNGGRPIDLLTSRRSFVKDPLLARTYGVAPWSGSGAPVNLPEQRLGLLGRAALLDSGLAKTRPIMRGVFVRTQLLCDEIAPPPPNAQAMQGTPDKTKPIREQTDAQTAPAICAGCHKRYINGLGYALEGFDALARLRTEETVIDLDSGATLGRYPVNTSAQAWVYDTDEKQVNGPKDLVDRIALSGKVPSCLARKAFRFTFAREEDETADGCTLEAARAAFDGSRGLSAGWRSFVMTPAFRQRVFQ